jgi:hypothetical protein
MHCGSQIAAKSSEILIKFGAGEQERETITFTVGNELNALSCWQPFTVAALEVHRQRSIGKFVSCFDEEQKSG